MHTFFASIFVVCISTTMRLPFPLFHLTTTSVAFSIYVMPRTEVSFTVFHWSCVGHIMPTAQRRITAMTVTRKTSMIPFQIFFIWLSANIVLLDLDQTLFLCRTIRHMEWQFALSIFELMQLELSKNGHEFHDTNYEHTPASRPIVRVLLLRAFQINRSFLIPKRNAICVG